jgi:hypothetical protein
MGGAQVFSLLRRHPRREGAGETEVEMTELEIRTDNTMTLHGTGETFDLADPEQAARALVAIDRYLEHVRDAYREPVVDRLWELGRQLGRQTLHFQSGVTVVLSDNERVEWNIPGLRAGLDKAGLPPERAEQLIKTTVTEKVDMAVAKQLSGANEAYARVIDLARQSTPASRWYARVKR